jgi:hypothetical protein
LSSEKRTLSIFGSRKEAVVNLKLTPRKKTTRKTKSSQVTAAFLLGLEAVLTALDGSRQSFDAADKKATIVIFVSTVCPVSADYSPGLPSFGRSSARGAT